MTDTVLTHLERGVLKLTLNRPSKKNALTPSMYDSLRHALVHATVSDDVRVVAITANGDYFCSGNDVTSFKLILDIPIKERPGFRFMNVVAHFSKPLVLALNGDAIGIGATLAFHADLTYAAPGVALKFPFTDLAIVPEFGSTFLAPRLLGRQKANELFLLKQKMSSEDALHFGLITEIIAAQHLAQHTDTVCRDLALKNPNAILACKRLMRCQEYSKIGAVIRDETTELSTLLNAKLSQREAES